MTTRDYFKLQEEYQNQYGNTTVVLFQRGSFYEIYEYDFTEDPDAFEYKKIGKCREICLLLNIIITRLDTSQPHSIDNPYLCGFPCITYERYRHILVEHNYKIIRIHQPKAKKRINTN